MKRLLQLLLVASFVFGTTAMADGGGGDSSREPADPIVESANAAIDKKDWAGASNILKDAVTKTPNNADYHNLYAYSLRKGTNPDMNLVFKHYGDALRINPKHRGAHEYIGEAYLMVNNLAKAKEHLAKLDDLCFFPCGEYTDLKKAVAEYESKNQNRAAR